MPCRMPAGHESVAGKRQQGEEESLLFHRLVQQNKCTTPSHTDIKPPPPGRQPLPPPAAPPCAAAAPPQAACTCGGARPPASRRVSRRCRSTTPHGRRCRRPTCGRQAERNLSKLHAHHGSACPNIARHSLHAHVRSLPPHLQRMLPVHCPAAAPPSACTVEQRR